MHRKVFISNLGCPKNEVDGYTMAAYLEREGCRLVSDPENADILIVNTCGFIEDAKRESIDEILEMAEIKKTDDSKILVVAGCLAQRYFKELSAEMPEVDYFLGIRDLKNVMNIVNDSQKRTFTGNLKGPYSKSDLYPLHQPRTYEYLKISDGCDNLCSYCAIPLIRGRFRSRQMSDIVNEARYHVESGTKELILIAQDTSMYGVDSYGRKALPGLLRQLSSIEGKFRIRLLYLHPAKMDDDIIDSIFENEKVLPYLDIPMQHISDKILRAMNRKITGKALARLVKKLRTRIPDLTIRTTYLVGFPGEKKRDFEKLLRFQDDYNIERVGVFGYSSEEGTRAHSLTPRVRADTIARRVDELMTLVQEQSFSRNEKLVGSVQSVIVDGAASEGHSFARMDSQAPEIDGVVLLKGRFRRGSMIQAGIKSAEAYDLYAEPVRKE